MSTTALNIHIENQKDILNLQIIQKHLGEVEIAFSLIKIDNKKQIEEAIKKEFSSKLGKNFIVKTRFVEDNKIYRTKTGKVPYLVSYIKEN